MTAGTFTPGYTTQNLSLGSGIGTLHSTGEPGKYEFRCNDPGCDSKPFKQKHGLLRHYDAKHAAEKPVFWCPVFDCHRAEGERGKPLSRKDKLSEHIKKDHPWYK